jgi:hypothetical protein
MPNRRDQELKIIVKKLESIEERISKISSRRERQRQFKLLLYSMISAAMASLAVSTTIKMLENTFGPFIVGVGFIIIYLAFYALAFLIISMRSMYEIGDFVIECKFTSDKFKRIFNDILDDRILKISEFEKKELGVRLRGLQTFDYYLRRFREKYDKKIEYIRPIQNEIKKIKWKLYVKQKSNNFSEIILSRKNGECKLSVGLDSKDFSFENAIGILDKIKRYQERGILKIESKEGF